MQWTTAVKLKAVCSLSLVTFSLITVWTRTAWDPRWHCTFVDFLLIWWIEVIELHGIWSSTGTESAEKREAFSWGYMQTCIFAFKAIPFKIAASCSTRVTFAIFRRVTIWIIQASFIGRCCNHSDTITMTAVASCRLDLTACNLSIPCSQRKWKPVVQLFFPLSQDKHHFVTHSSIFTLFLLPYALPSVSLWNFFFSWTLHDAARDVCDSFLLVTMGNMDGEGQVGL